MRGSVFFFKNVCFCTILDITFGMVDECVRLNTFYIYLLLLVFGFGSNGTKWNIKHVRF